jgi:hypothetical protein
VNVKQLTSPLFGGKRGVYRRMEVPPTLQRPLALELWGYPHEDLGQRVKGSAIRKNSKHKEENSRMYTTRLGTTQQK